MLEEIKLWLIRISGICIMILVVLLVLHSCQNSNSTQPRSGGEMPYFHYTLYSDHLNIRIYKSCNEINSAYDDYRFFVCDEEDIK